MISSLILKEHSGFEVLDMHGFSPCLLEEIKMPETARFKYKPSLLSSIVSYYGEIISMEQTGTMAIPREQLADLGFIEVKSRLFAKHISQDLILYRDYRTDFPSTYAYLKNQRVDHNRFKEARAIEVIERGVMMSDAPNRLSPYG